MEDIRRTGYVVEDVRRIAENKQQDPEVGSEKIKSRSAPAGYGRKRGEIGR